MSRLIAILVLNLVFSITAIAAEPLAALYQDPDPAASALHAPPGMHGRLRQMLNASIRKNPKNSVALAHRAFMFGQSGDLVLANRDYDAALKWAPPGSEHERHVLWSRGWTEYNLGDYAGTLRDWQHAEQLHGGRPFWISYSYALVYWTLNEKKLALAWFDVAVVSEPPWGTPDGFAKKIDHWQPNQQEQMRALFDAWSKQHKV